jgi:hypothetical protein
MERNAELALCSDVSKPRNVVRARDKLDTYIVVNQPLIPN